MSNVKLQSDDEVETGNPNYNTSFAAVEDGQRNQQRGVYHLITVFSG